MDISNKSLALILVASIVISAGSTFMAIVKLDQLGGIHVVTGRASSSGTGIANLTVTSLAQLIMRGNFINFEGGYADGSACVLNSTYGVLPSSSCTGFRDANETLVVENTGNINLTINISFDYTAAGWIGGTSPYIKFEVTNNESDACENFSSYGGVGNWTSAPATAGDSTCVCQGSSSTGRLQYVDNKDALSIEIAVSVPTDALPDSAATDNLTITFTGSDADTDQY